MTPHAMHPNSLAAFAAIKDDRSERAEQIYALLRRMDRPMSDREIMKYLGFTERNATAPRITELLENRWLIETGSGPCPITGKTVRRTYALCPEERDELIAKQKAQVTELRRAAAEARNPGAQLTLSHV